MSDLISIADIRRITGHPDHVINHALKRHGPPARGRIGIARVWAMDDLPEIEASIARTQQARAGEAVAAA